MRKYLLIAMSAIAMLFATSCQDDLGLDTGNEALVSFTVSTPDMATRAYSDGATATVLQYAVYDAAGNILGDLTKTDATINGSATVNLRLTTGNTYSVIFWAAAPVAPSAPNAPYTVDFATKTMTVNYAGAVSNDENRDAFYKYHTFTVNGAQTEKVELKRPFAQLNIGTADYAASTNAGYTPTMSYVKVSEVYSKLNFVDGTVSDKIEDVVFDDALIPDADDETFPVTGYDYLAMNYLLVGAQDKEVVDIEFAYTDGSNRKTRTVGSVPVQRNYRTNIYGKLLTSEVDITVTINPEYETPDNDKEIKDLLPVYYDEYQTEVVDGVGILATKVNDEGVTVPDVYGVSSANGMKWVVAQINGTTLARTALKQYEVNGKTIKLLADIDLYEEDENGNQVCFEPIGNYKKEIAFTGVFDGDNHTIKNLSQNTWALDWGYYYGSGLGLGLFSCVEDATIKNLKIDNASLSGESALCGIVAATAYGECTFENITVTNSQCADYQYYAGGIVGWASGNHKYINCNVDATTTVATQWGDFDNSTGGVIGGAGGSATILMKDCNVACRIDAVSDVVSAYRWYAYRRCGMLIGNTGKTKVVGETTYADAPQLTCENVKVTYGDWANYTYCEFAGTGYPYVRVQAGISVEAYSNVRYGHPTDANGNTVVDDNHVHNEGEDHHILIQFDQLYGGGQGVYGQPTHDGVTVIYNNK